MTLQQQQICMWNQVVTTAGDSMRLWRHCASGENNESGKQLSQRRQTGREKTSNSTAVLQQHSSSSSNWRVSSCVFARWPFTMTAKAAVVAIITATTTTMKHSTVNSKSSPCHWPLASATPALFAALSGFQLQTFPFAPPLLSPPTKL